MPSGRKGQGESDHSETDDLTSCGEFCVGSVLNTDTLNETPSCSVKIVCEKFSVSRSPFDVSEEEDPIPALVLEVADAALVDVEDGSVAVDCSIEAWVVLDEGLTCGYAPRAVTTISAAITPEPSKGKIRSRPFADTMPIRVD